MGSFITPRSNNCETAKSNAVTTLGIMSLDNLRARTEPAPLRSAYVVPAADLIPISFLRLFISRFDLMNGTEIMKMSASTNTTQSAMRIISSGISIMRPIISSDTAIRMSTVFLVERTILSIAADAFASLNSSLFLTPKMSFLSCHFNGYS